MLTRASSNNTTRLIWFDIETTGFNIFKDSIIEIAAIDDNDTKFSSLISYNKPLPAKITQITNITNEMLEDKPLLEDVLTDFCKYIKGDVSKPYSTTYLIGHNAHAFDLPFIKAQCSKYSIKFPRVVTLDTMRMSQLLLDDQYSHSLKTLCSLFSVNNEQAHRAMSDVGSTRIIFNNLCLLFKRKFQRCSPNMIYNKTCFVN